MTDTPEPGPKQDDERIVIRPRPGGRRALAPEAVPQAPEPSPPEPSPPEPGLGDTMPLEGPPAAAGTPATDGFGLVAAAMPLLQLLSRLRSLASPPDAAFLRSRVEAELTAFGERAERAGFAADLVRRANYALCASLDDVVLNTPWGSSGAWADRPLVAALHPNIPASRFFDVLAQAQDKPALLPVLELMHACLSLGVLGPQRQAANGAAEAERLRAEAYAAIQARRPAPAAALSGQWQGADAPYRPRRTVVPVWVAASAGLAVLAGLFLVLSDRVADQSDAVFTRMVSAPPAAMPRIVRAALPVPPPIPPAPEPGVLDRLRARLAGGEAAVAGTQAAPVVRLPARLLFAPGSATLLPGAAPLIDRAAAALKPEAGTLRVVGYTDSQPFRSVQFPSNFQLSAARALAVRTALARSLGDGAKLLSEGRAAADPVASNASAEGREANRRIDLVLKPS